jgi:hypothetical protein
VVDNQQQTHGLTSLSRIHILQVHKVQHKPRKKSVRGHDSFGAKNLSELKIGTPDCPVCHRIVSGAPGPYDSKPVTLRNYRARSTIIHWTVWCATGLSGEPAEQRLPAHPTVDCGDVRAEQCCAEVRSAEVRRHRTVRCSKTTKLPTVDQLRTLTVALTWRTPNIL